MADKTPRRVRALRLIVRTSPPRVVLDTNLFVAAYWQPRGASARILRACEEDELRLLSSAAIRRELFRILRNARTSPEHQRRVADLVADGEDLTPTRSLHLVADDPDDDKFVECAVEGGADYIVSSDVHLLALGSVEGIPIVKPGVLVRECLGGE